MTITRRHLNTSALALAGAAVTGPVWAQSKKVVKLGFLYPNLTTLAYGIADQMGAYKDIGFELQAQRYTSGQTVDGIHALLRGDVDVYYGGGPEAVRLNSRFIEQGGAAPLAVISASNPGHTNFVLNKKLQQKTFDDLKGQPLRVAVSSPSSDHLALFRGWLTSFKKMKTSDLAWQFITFEGGNMPTALLTNQIDGFLHSEPTTTLAATSGVGYVFMAGSRGDFGPNPPPMTFMAANREFLKKSPDLARAFMKATQSANDFLQKVPKPEMVQIISKWSGTKVSVVEEAYDRINPRLGITKEQAQQWWDFIGMPMVERGELSKKMDPFRDIFDLNFQV